MFSGVSLSLTCVAGLGGAFSSSDHSRSASKEWKTQCLLRTEPGTGTLSLYTHAFGHSVPCIESQNGCLSSRGESASHIATAIVTRYNRQISISKCLTALLFLTLTGNVTESVLYGLP